MSPLRSRSSWLAALTLASGCAHAGPPPPPRALVVASPVASTPPLADGIPAGTIARLELDLVALRGSPFGDALLVHVARVASELGLGDDETLSDALRLSRRACVVLVEHTDHSVRWLFLARGSYPSEVAHRLSLAPASTGEDATSRDVGGLASLVLGDHTWLVGDRDALEDGGRRLTGRLPPLRSRDPVADAFGLVGAEAGVVGFSFDLAGWERAGGDGSNSRGELAPGGIAVSGSVDLSETMTAYLGIVTPDAESALRTAEQLRLEWTSSLDGQPSTGFIAALRRASLESHGRGAVLTIRLTREETIETLTWARLFVAGVSREAIAGLEDDELGFERDEPRPPRHGPTPESNALIGDLAALGYFRTAGNADAVREAEKWARETGWPFDHATGRVFAAVPEELVDGGLEPFFESIRPFLLRSGVRVDVVEAPGSEGLALVADGRRVVLLSERELEGQCWSELLGLRLSGLVDGWLSAVGSKDRSYFLDPADDPQLVLLTPEMMARIRRHPDYDPLSWPMRLSDDPVPGCEDAYDDAIAP